MTLLYAGAQVDRVPGPRYAATLPFAELAPSAPLPRKSTLTRWKHQLPEGFQLALVLPREMMVSNRGWLRFDDSLEDRFPWVREAVDTLEPAILVVPTGAEVTTGQRDRDLLRAYFERLPQRENTTRVWAPAGLWETEVAAGFAKHLGVTCAFDPLEAPAPAGPVAYARLAAMGARTRFGEGMLQRALEEACASGAECVYFSIRSNQSFREAKRLQMLATGDAGMDHPSEESEASE